MGFSPGIWPGSIVVVEREADFECDLVMRHPAVFEMAARLYLREGPVTTKLCRMASDFTERAILRKFEPARREIRRFSELSRRVPTS